VLSIQIHLLCQADGPLKAPPLLEVDGLKAIEPLPDREDLSAVLEAADGQGGGKVLDAQLARLVMGLGEIVGKTGSAARATLPLPFQPRDKSQPLLVIVHLRDDLHLVQCGHLQQLAVALGVFSLGVDVRVGKIEHDRPPLSDEALD